MPETNARIKVCHDTAANFKTNNPTLLVGEWALETDTKRMKIGDGTTAYNLLPYSTAEDEDWVKPSGWVDIRSGALPNSIYFLVGHSADFTKYPEFSFNATISNSGTYDVFVDGVKQATTASGSDTLFNWQTLNIASGFDVTYPEALKTHIVRVTSTSTTDTIKSIKVTDQSRSGLLWAHFTIINAIDISNFTNSQTRILEAVTSSSDLIVDSLYAAFVLATQLKELPILDCQNKDVNPNSSFQECSKIKKISFKNFNALTRQPRRFHACYSLEKIECINSCFLTPAENEFWRCYSLKELPPFGNFGNNISNVNCVGIFTDCKNVKDTLLDFSIYPQFSRLTLGGASNSRLDWVKGLIVSPEALFNSTTSPQLDVSYTGLNRGALINFFNSLPYNVGYQVSGSPTIEGGIASGFSSGYVYTSSYPENLSTAGSWEIGIKFLFNNLTRRDILFVYRGDGYTKRSIQLEHYGPSKKFTCTLSSDGRTNDIIPSGDNAFFENLTADDVGHWFTIKIVYTGTSYDFYVKKDDGDFSLTRSVVSDKKMFCNSGFVFGYNDKSASEYTDGSIDLNNTYINVNGVPWFRGAAQKTRTLDIRGCTGTADLTQDDKNIVLNKGWDLTVE